MNRLFSKWGDFEQTVPYCTKHISDILKHCCGKCLIRLRTAGAIVAQSSPISREISFMNVGEGSISFVSKKTLNDDFSHNLKLCHKRQEVSK